MLQADYGSLTNTNNVFDYSPAGGAYQLQLPSGYDAYGMVTGMYADAAHSQPWQNSSMMTKAIEQ